MDRKRVPDMDNTFRSAVFGGFNRQDVTEYIGKMAQEHQERLTGLEQENARQETELRQAQEELKRLAPMEAEAAQLREKCQQLTEELTAAKQEGDRLRQQVEADAGRIGKMADLEREAAEYSGVKGHIADIELEARRRADAMLADAQHQAEKIIADARMQAQAVRQSLQEELRGLSKQYQAVAKDFSAASGHVSSELRKMDVMAGQLPLAFDHVQEALVKLEAQAAGEKEPG